MPAPEPVTADNYRSGKIFKTICEDFHKKCYLCGNKIRAVNIDHIVPHRGDPILKIDWNNLFLACVHCNSIKSDIFDNIINCTIVDPEDVIKVLYIPFPTYIPKFKLKDENRGHAVQGKQTIDLLDRIFNEPTTSQKVFEAGTLCDDLYQEVKLLINEIETYRDATNVDDEEKCLIRLRSQLSRSSPFAAFKRAYVRGMNPNRDWVQKLQELTAD